MVNIDHRQTSIAQKKDSDILYLIQTYYELEMIKFIERSIRLVRMYNSLWLMKN